MEWDKRTTAVLTLDSITTVDGVPGIRHLIATSYAGGFSRAQQDIIASFGNAYIVESIPKTDGNLHHAEIRAMEFANAHALPKMSLAIAPRPSCPREALTN